MIFVHQPVGQKTSGDSIGVALRAGIHLSHEIHFIIVVAPDGDGASPLPEFDVNNVLKEGIDIL